MILDEIIAKTKEDLAIREKYFPKEWLVRK